MANASPEARAALVAMLRQHHHVTMAVLTGFRRQVASDTERLRLLNLYTRAFGFPRYAHRVRRACGVAA